MTRRFLGGRWAPTLVLPLVLVLAGCGASADATSDSEPAPGPLDEYFEQAYGDYDEDEMTRDMQRVEEVIAECMAEEGFEYIPVDQSQGMSMSSDELDIDWGSREFAEEYGYGITTNPWGDPEEQPMTEDEFVDPNQEYLESMSETEMEAYYLALYGDQVFEEDLDGEGEYEYDWEQNGCQGYADHQVNGGGEEMEDPALVSLEEEMNAMWERTVEDPRVTAAEAEWAQCMADGGITGMTTVDEAQMRIIDESNAVYDDVYGDGSEELSEEDYLAMESKIEERLAEITDEEIRVAVADWDCQDEIGYRGTIEKVSHELQEEFVETHRAELEAWVEAVNAGRS